jgi:hypothetical protein
VFVAVLAEIAAGASTGASSWADVDPALRRSMLANAGELALIVADTASPFIIVEDIRTAVRALDALLDTLNVLAYIEAAKPELREAEEDGVKAPLPSLLPQVHTTWPFFVSAISAGRDVTCRRALEHIAKLAQLCGGDFLRERMKNDLWPYLRRHLAHSAGARTRVAVLEFVKRVAGDFASRESLRKIAMPIADCVVELVSKRVLSSADGELEFQVLESLAMLDGDGIYLLLWRLGRVALPAAPAVQTPLATGPLFLISA